MTVNKVLLIGNLGADPETRTTPSGTVVANLRLATTERVKRGEEWISETEWHRVVCFGKTAENVARFCQKGKQLYIEGRIRTQKWTDKEGKDRWSTEVVANQVKFLGGKGEGESQGGGGGGGGGYQRGGGGGGGYQSGGGGRTQTQKQADIDSDIPF